MMKNRPGDIGDPLTEEWLRQQFSAITYDRSSPSAGEAQRNATPVTSRVRWLALAAAVTFVLAISPGLLPIGTDPAWAATPTAVTKADEQEIRKACQKRIESGPGELEYSGEAHVDGSMSRIGVEGDLSLPTSLPPTVVIDRRDTGAVGIFGSLEWTVVCLVKLVDNRWVDNGVQILGAAEASGPAIALSGQLNWEDGDFVLFVSGSLPEGKACATFTLDNGQIVDASCAEGHFAVWYPDDVMFDPDSLSFN